VHSHSTGGDEVARCIRRHGTKRFAKAVPVGTVTPLMLKTQANPGGLPIETFDAIAKASIPAAAHSLRAGFLSSADAGGAALDDSIDQSGHASRSVAAQDARHGNPWKADRARAARLLKL